MQEENKTWTPEEIAAQLRKPDGDGGKIVAENMQTANLGLYNMALEELPATGQVKLLEIGFGNGAHFNRFFEKNPQAHLSGLDFSQSMYDLAAQINAVYIQNNQLELKLGDASEMPFDTNTFDYIIAINTIYFWPDIDLYLTEIRRVLKPGGILLIGYRPKATMDLLSFTDYGFRKYEIEEMAEILNKNKLELITQKQISDYRTSVSGERYWNTDIVAVSCKS